ncbi:MAG: hypothetical protein IKP40_08875 [Clostridia bacterium]|nr:hypothetical protein [Clostridia bacterium]
MVWAEIWAPRYWWIEFDTYRVGVEKLSCSTMHKLTSRPLTFEDFEPTEDGCYSQHLTETVKYLNALIEGYNSAKDADEKKKLWRYLIQALPQSLIQRRTVMISYAALRNMYRQRNGHRLKEWEAFRDWCKTLPESWMITGVIQDATGTD